MVYILISYRLLLLLLIFCTTIFIISGVRTTSGMNEEVVLLVSYTVNEVPVRKLSDDDIYEVNICLKHVKTFHIWYQLLVALCGRMNVMICVKE